MLRRDHFLKSAKLDVIPYIPPEDGSKRMIIVKGINEDIDTEVLEMYFESKKKSGGGEIEHLERKSNTIAVITFKEVEGKSS